MIVIIIEVWWQMLVNGRLQMQGNGSPSFCVRQSPLSGAGLDDTSGFCAASAFTRFLGGDGGGVGMWSQRGSAREASSGAVRGHAARCGRSQVCVSVDDHCAGGGTPGGAHVARHSKRVTESGARARSLPFCRSLHAANRIAFYSYSSASHAQL